MRHQRSSGDGWLRAGLVVAMVALAALVIGACGSAQSSSAGSSAHTTNASPAQLLGAVILSPSQIGRPGYQERLYQGGRSVQGQVTLDLCGFRFASESLRTARLQVGYVKSPQLPVLSNEVVTYKPDGTVVAMQELHQAVRRCPRKPVAGPVAGVPPIAYRLSELRDSRLLPGYLAVVSRETAVINGKRKSQTAIAIYQTHRNILSAVYAFGPDATMSKLMALDAAEQSAHNLATR